jgi:O-antigen/teichoic acid export membrane protein
VSSGLSERENTDPAEAAIAVPSETPDRPGTPEARALLRRAPIAYLWNQLGSLWLFLASFLLTTIAARTLGTERYGIFAVALTFFNTAVYAAAFGLEDAATVFVPRTFAQQSRAATGALLRRLLVARGLAALAVCATLYWAEPSLVAWLDRLSLPGGASLADAVRIPDFAALALPLVVYVAGSAMMNLLAALFTALLRTRLTLAVGGVAQLTNVAGVLLAGRLGWGVAGVIWALGVVTWLATVVYFVLLLPLLRTPAASTPPTRPAERVRFAPVLRLGGTAWLTNLISGALLKQVAVSLLQYFLIGVGTIGYFNLAFQLSHAAAFLLIAGLGGVGMAAMSAAFAAARHDGLTIAWRSVSKAQILLAVPVLAFFFLNADAIAVLLYGHDNAAVGPLMRIFLVFNIAQRLAGGGSHQAALYVLRRQGSAFAAQAAGLLLTLGLGVLLIPQGGEVGGAAGALIAVGAGQVAVELLQLALVWRVLRRGYPIQFGIRVSLAVVPALLLAALLPLDMLVRAPAHLGGLAIPASVFTLTFSAVAFTVLLLAGLALAKPIEQEDVALLAQVNARLKPFLAPFASVRRQR